VYGPAPLAHDAPEARREPGGPDARRAGDLGAATTAQENVGIETQRAAPRPVRAAEGAGGFRRSDYDVTDTVQVSSFAAVRRAVESLFRSAWPDGNFEPVSQSFRELERLFDGEVPGFRGVDTVYHDRQHTLDMTLATARLLVGYERQARGAACLGSERAAVGLVTALFHDSGYVRESADQSRRNGAELTTTHVSRSARHLARCLPAVGLGAWTEVATRVVHFTGYEVPFASIEVSDPRDRTVGHLLGTADLIAQMSDRCYLEKCRDRLYPEFVLGGVALGRNDAGDVRVRYSSGLDLLRQTPAFYEQTKRERLDGAFEGSYRYVEALYDGHNPYIAAMEQNQAFLQRVLRSENWPMLRRNPPCFTHEPDPLPNVRSLMLGHLKALWRGD
jgi:hypothetical protein